MSNNKNILRDKFEMEMILKFLNDLKEKDIISAGEVETHQKMLNKFWNFVERQKLTQKEIDYFLKLEDEESLFLINYFIQFLKNANVKLKSPIGNNLEKIGKVVYKRPIVPQDYDLRIALQSLQFQIDSYYEPKILSSKRKKEIVLNALNPKPGEKILDVGCGVGTFAYHSAKAGAHAWGIDYSRKSIEVAKILCNRFGVSSKTEFITCDATKKLSFEDFFFDKIVAADFMEHITDQQKEEAIKEMCRVLKPLGLIIIFTPNGFREAIGFIKRKIERLFKKNISETRLHFGLTNRFKFERLLKGNGLEFKRSYVDTGRPFLAKIPVLKEILSLKLLWVIRKSSKKRK